MGDRFVNHKCGRSVRGAGRGARLLCLIFVSVLLLTSGVGCSALVSVDELETLRAELESEIAALEQKNAVAQQKIDALTSDSEAAHQTIDSLTDKNERAKQEIDTLKADNAAAKEEIEALKAGKLTAQQRIDALEAACAAAQAEIARLEAARAQAQKEIDALKADHAAAKKEIDALEAASQAAAQEIEQLKKHILELQDQITPTEKIRIYIDQGHNPTGSHNAGASGNGLYEQDVTFTIGQLLAQLLREDGRFEVCLSRPTRDTVLGTDNASSLEARVQGAKAFGADYFISLHTNSFSSESANGIEVFVAEEGSASYTFGSYLLEGLVNETKLRDRGMKLNPDLYVLKNAPMPAALLEMGFISNAGDATLMKQSPLLFATGIYEGILAYFALLPRN